MATELKPVTSHWLLSDAPAAGCSAADDIIYIDDKRPCDSQLRRPLRLTQCSECCVSGRRTMRLHKILELLRNPGIFSIAASLPYCAPCLLITVDLRVLADRRLWAAMGSQENFLSFLL